MLDINRKVFALKSIFYYLINNKGLVISIPIFEENINKETILIKSIYNDVIILRGLK